MYTTIISYRRGDDCVRRCPAHTPHCLGRRNIYVRAEGSLSALVTRLLARRQLFFVLIFQQKTRLLLSRLYVHTYLPIYIYVVPSVFPIAAACYRAIINVGAFCVVRRFDPATILLGIYTYADNFSRCSKNIIPGENKPRFFFCALQSQD